MDREGWNQRYGGRDLVWTAEPNRFLVGEVGDLPPGRALDLGCGEGRNAVWLVERGWQVTAVDFSDVALDKGRRLARSRDAADAIEWIHADLTTWTPTPRAFDLVAALYVHLPRTSMRAVLRAAAGAVAPGGTLLVVGHDRTNLERGHGGPRSPDVLYDARAVEEALDGLDVVDAGTRDRPVTLDDGGEAVAIDCLVRATRPTAG